MEPLRLPLLSSGLLAALLMFVTVAAAGAEELVLTFTLSEVRETVMKPAGPETSGAGNAADATPRTERTTETVELILGGTYFVLSGKEGTTVYDFPAKRVLIQKAGTETWTGRSLYSDISFRVNEYQNRIMLGKILSESGVKDPGMLLGAGDVFQLETLFGLRMPDERDGPVSGLMCKTGGDGSLTFSLKGGEAALFEPSGTVVPKALAEMYLRYFVYHSRLHPEIRRQIVETARVPALLRTHWTNTGERGTTTLELKKADVRDGNTHAPAPGLIIGDGETGELHELLAASRDPQRWEQRLTKDAVVQSADRTMSEGRILDGMLIMLEYQLQSGDPISDEIRKHKELIGADPLCKQFMEALNQSDKASCERSVELLRAMDRTGLTKAHVLDIQLADALTSLGQGAEAEKVFFSVLRQNPLIAGVWKDLGGVYHEGYEMGKAWLCWDNARRLYPDHPMLSGITGLEHRLEYAFPEFFLPAAGSGKPD